MNQLYMTKEKAALELIKYQDRIGTTIVYQGKEYEIEFVVVFNFGGEFHPAYQFLIPGENLYTSVKAN